jgi:hypothetical protein
MTNQDMLKRIISWAEGREEIREKPDQTRFVRDIRWF